MDIFEKDALQLLQKFGLDCNSVPRLAQKTCDFECIDDCGQVYFVEVKSVQLPTNANFHNPSTGFTHVQNWFDRDSASQSMRTGGKQLKSTAELRKCRSAIQLLWISALPQHDGKFLLEQALGELLGIRGVVCTFRNQDPPVHMRCMFAKPSRFERLDSVSGAIFRQHDGAQLFRNPFCHDEGQLKHSALGKLFASHRAFFDPDDLNLSTSEYLVCSNNINRRDDCKITAYLCDKYHLDDARLCDFKRYSTSVFIPASQIGRTGSRPIE